jgi:hypothetical protein
MSSKKIFSTLGAGFAMAALAVYLGMGAAAATVDGHRIHHVHKTSHRLYNYARPTPYAYDGARSGSYEHCIIPTAYSVNGICW